MSVFVGPLTWRWVTAAALALVVGAGLLTAALTLPPREVVLVARDMAFYLDSDPLTPNPAIVVAPGEAVRLVLRNEDRGMRHNVAIDAQGAATSLVAWKESGEMIFVAPVEPGDYEYACRPHRSMMRGVLRVTAPSMGQRP